MSYHVNRSSQLEGRLSSLEMDGWRMAERRRPIPSALQELLARSPASRQGESQMTQTAHPHPTIQSRGLPGRRAAGEDSCEPRGTAKGARATNLCSDSEYQTGHRCQKRTSARRIL